VPAYVEIANKRVSLAKFQTGRHDVACQVEGGEAA